MYLLDFITLKKCFICNRPPIVTQFRYEEFYLQKQITQFFLIFKNHVFYCYLSCPWTVLCVFSLPMCSVTQFLPWLIDSFPAPVFPWLPHVIKPSPFHVFLSGLQVMFVCHSSSLLWIYPRVCSLKDCLMLLRLLHSFRQWIMTLSCFIIVFYCVS